MHHFVYHTVITNVKTKAVKHYFGKHSTNNLNDGYVGSGRYIQNCKNINKTSGTYNFETVIVSFSDRNSLNDVERNLIKMGFEQFGNDCKNISKGGDGFDWTGRTHTDEAKKKISLSGLGRTHTSETKEKMSMSKIGSKCHMYGLPKTDDIKRKISEKLKSKNLKGVNSTSFKGYYSTPYGLLATSGEGKKYGIPPSTLRRWCSQNKEGYSFIEVSNDKQRETAQNN
ncbi:NUMOD3 domain-containing DNA-binding protein [Enterobacter hormaechei]